MSSIRNVSQGCLVVLLFLTVLIVDGFHLQHPHQNEMLSKPLRLNTAKKLQRLQDSKANKKPNFIIFFADDLGYGDLSYNGHPTIHTPHIDYYALSGIRLTTWYSGFHVCSPSRAAMLSGRLCVRSGTCGGWSGGVFRAGAKGGLPTDEVTFAKILGKVGYASKVVGKWHLGVKNEYMPIAHGFDSYLGIPYSVDMACSVWGEHGHSCDDHPLPLIQNNNTVIQQPVDLSKLSDIYYSAAVQFINESVASNKPFVLYFPHNHVHVPDYMSPASCNTSARGFFGAAVEELDRLIGSVMQYIESIDIDSNTLVFFTSDNGPWMTQRLAGGSAALFRGAKQNTWEGGVRMPAWAYWKGMIDAGSRSMEITATYDIFSTMINIANATEYLPKDGRIYDGRDMSDILFNLNGGKTQHDCIFYWGGMPNDTSCPYNKTSANYGLCQGLWAVRCGEYKAHFVTRDQNGSHTLQEPALLFNVNWDPSEKHPIWPDNKQYDAIMSGLINARNKHLSGIYKVPNEIEKGSTSDNYFCGDPNSQEKYPKYPNCTLNPENWNAFVCNPVCLAYDKCGTSDPGTVFINIEDSI